MKTKNDSQKVGIQNPRCPKLMHGADVINSPAKICPLKGRYKKTVCFDFTSNVRMAER